MEKYSVISCLNIFLKEQSADGHLPSMKLLKMEKEILLWQKNSRRIPLSNLCGCYDSNETNMFKKYLPL